MHGLRLALVVMALLVGIVARPAMAAPAVDRGLVRGMDLYSAASFGKALKVLRAAAGRVTDPQQLATIHVFVGCCHIELRDESAAREALRVALVHVPTARLDIERFKPAVVRRLAQIKRHLFGLLTVDSVVPGVTVHIDGKPWGSAPLKEAAVPPGLHTLELRASDRVVLRRRWSTTFGQADRFSVAPEPCPSCPAGERAERCAVTREIVQPGRLCSADGWCWENPFPRGDIGFHDIWGSGPDDVFLVGSCDTVLHYDGESWLAMPLPEGGPRTIRGVWGSGPTDVLVVGNAGAVAHYDGARWRVEVPARGLTDKPLHAVWGTGPTDRYVAGDAGLVMHHDGTRWREIPTGRKAHAVTALWGAGPKTVFAVGQGAGTWQRDGDQWTPMRQADHPCLRFTDAWGTGPSDVFAVGLAKTGCILHYNGKTWSPMKHPLRGYEGVAVPVEVSAVWGAASNAVWAIADTGKLLRFDGKGWQVAATIPGPRLEAMWGSGPTDILIAGTGGAVVRYDGQKHFKRLDSSFVDRRLMRVDVRSGGRVHVFTDRGRPYERLSGAWAKVIFTPMGHATEYMYRLGLFPDRVRPGKKPYGLWMARSWKLERVPVWDAAAGKLRSVDAPGDARRRPTAFWDAGGGKLVAVGPQGGAHHYDGKAWQQRETPVDKDLLAVWGSGPRHVVAVGMGGTVIRFDGRRWRRERIPVKRAGALPWENMLLTAVWGSGPRDVFVVGIQGVVLHFDGRRWRLQPTPAGHTLNAVWGSGPRDVYAVGKKGTILHYDGHAWTQVHSGTRLDLHDVAGDSPENVWAVGEQGTVLHLGPR